MTAVGKIIIVGGKKWLTHAVGQAQVWRFMVVSVFGALESKLHWLLGF